jgi:ABC-type antimicrobial peptide transport system permease subunit
LDRTGTAVRDTDRLKLRTGPFVTCQVSDGESLDIKLKDGFSAIALLLAAIGLFGVMLFLIAARTREIGIRIALGARPYQMVSWVLGKGMLMAGAGILLGLLASLLTSRLLESMLFATTPTDILT